MAECERDEDAAFIVTACNAHDQLVAQIEQLTDGLKTKDADLAAVQRGLREQVQHSDEVAAAMTAQNTEIGNARIARYQLENLVLRLVADHQVMNLHDADQCVLCQDAKAMLPKAT